LPKGYDLANSGEGNFMPVVGVDMMSEVVIELTRRPLRYASTKLDF
jgi:hypothetical protein